MHFVASKNHRALKVFDQFVGNKWLASSLLPSEIEFWKFEIDHSILLIPPSTMKPNSFAEWNILFKRPPDHAFHMSLSPKMNGTSLRKHASRADGQSHGVNGVMHLTGPATPPKTVKDHNRQQGKEQSKVFPFCVRS